jgi:hypothetical protein
MFWKCGRQILLLLPRRCQQAVTCSHMQHMQSQSPQSCHRHCRQRLTAPTVPPGFAIHQICRNSCSNGVTLSESLAPERSKIAEHGGIAEDDTHVALLVAGPGLQPAVIKTPVTTMQIAPTILEALGLEPSELKAVRVEKTAALPGLHF